MLTHPIIVGGSYALHQYLNEGSRWTPEDIDVFCVTANKRENFERIADAARNLFSQSLSKGQLDMDLNVVQYEIDHDLWQGSDEYFRAPTDEQIYGPIILATATFRCRSSIRLFGRPVQLVFY